MMAIVDVPRTEGVGVFSHGGALSARMDTFTGDWNDSPAAARQLAALGHTSGSDDGSRCIDCGAFVRRDDSVRALEGATHTAASTLSTIAFHAQDCWRLQVPLPLNPQVLLAETHGGFEIARMRQLFERGPRDIPSSAGRRQTASFLSLPAEMRLQIYDMILPTLDAVTTIVPLNRDSARVVTEDGYHKTGPRDLTRMNLLGTCRAVHDEALNLIYQSTTFRFATTRVLYLFLRAIGARGRRCLQSVDIQCGQRDDAVTFALLAECENLNNITIRLSRQKLIIADPPIWILDGTAALLELSGMKRVCIAPRQPVNVTNKFHTLHEHDTDAAILQRELTRPRGSRSQFSQADGVSWTTNFSIRDLD